MLLRTIDIDNTEYMFEVGWNNLHDSVLLRTSDTDIDNTEYMFEVERNNLQSISMWRKFITSEYNANLIQIV